MLSVWLGASWDKCGNSSIVQLCLGYRALRKAAVHAAFPSLETEEWMGPHRWKVKGCWSLYLLVLLNKYPSLRRKSSNWNSKYTTGAPAVGVGFSPPSVHVCPAAFCWAGQFSIEKTFLFNTSCLRCIHFFHSSVSVGLLSSHQERQDLGVRGWKDFYFFFTSNISSFRVGRNLFKYCTLVLHIKMRNLDLELNPCEWLRTRLW